MGRARAFERTRVRWLAGSRRVVALYYLTYHPLKPAAWELVFYRPPGADGSERWQVVSVRFATERLFAWLEGRQP